MLVVEIVLAAVVVFAVAAVAAGYGGAVTRFSPDWPGRPLPEGRPLRADDIAAARFSVAFRGYRMSEVDAVLDRLGWEIAARDARIEELTGRPYDGPIAPGAEFPALPAEYGAAEPFTDRPAAGSSVDRTQELPAVDAGQSTDVADAAAVRDQAQAEQ